MSGRSENYFTCQSLGFRDKETKAWKDFIRILQDAPHTYCIGPASKEVDGVKQKLPLYDAQRKLLDGINKKLVDYFNNKYPVQIWDSMPMKSEGVLLHFVRYIHSGLMTNPKILMTLQHRGI